MYHEMQFSEKKVSEPMKEEDFNDKENKKD